MVYVPAPIATPLDLKNRVEFLLTGILGEYTYKNGYKKPAIAVGNRHAEAISVTGIEAVIPSVFCVKSSQWVSYLVSQDRYADIILLEWSGDNLYACADRLLRHFPNSKGIEIPDYDPVKSLKQYRITVWLPDAFEGIKV